MTFKKTFVTISIWLFLITVMTLHVLAEDSSSHDLIQGEEEVLGDKPAIRTATGGLINKLLVALTVIAFIGNAWFLIYVFWLSK